MSQKKERATNFTELEVRLLVDVALRYSHIIENKKTDAVTCKDKTQAWEEIAKEVNAISGEVMRSGKVLRLKYDTIKRGIKQKMSKNKLEIFKTGGGAAELVTLTDYEDKLLHYISLSVEGLPTENDSDQFLAGSTLDDTFRSQPETPSTSTSNASCSTNVVYEQPDQDGETFGKNTTATDNIMIIMEEGEQVPLGVVNKNITAETFTKWKSWKPKLLKEKKHTALLSTAKKSCISKQSLNNKIDVLTESRNDLTKMQTKIAEQEIQDKQKYSIIRQELLYNEEDRQKQQHEKLMNNLNLQHQLLTSMHERYKRESELRERLLQLEIDNEELNIQIKQKQL